MAGGEFLGLAHIDDDGFARCEAALQFSNLDPCRRIHPRPTEQSGQKCYPREYSKTERAVTQGLRSSLRQAGYCQLLTGCTCWRAR